MKVYLNGKFVEEKDAHVSLLDPGFLYGQGLFETMRSYNGRIFRLDSHIERLVKSAALINLKLDADEKFFKEALKSSLIENNAKDAYLRLTVWQGETKANIAVLVKNYNFLKKEDYNMGFRAIVSKFRQNEKSRLSGVKSLNYLLLLLAYEEAKEKGAHEALLLNTKDFVAEASRSNVFLIKDNCVITPSLDSGCLCGITRDTVLDIARKERIKIIETNVKLEDLEKAEEAFLTNSLIEVMPLVSIEDKPIKKGVPGKITEIILKKYKELV